MLLSCLIMSPTLAGLPAKLPPCRCRSLTVCFEASLLPQADDDENLFRPAPAAPGEQKGMNRLYGHWQTAEWAPPQATGGRVPKNERGQVDVPPFAKTLPQGELRARRLVAMSNHTFPQSSTGWRQRPHDRCTLGDASMMTCPGNPHGLSAGADRGVVTGRY